MIKRTLLVALLAVLTIGAVPVLAAPRFMSSDVVDIISPIGDDTYIGGGQITVDRDIAGDLFIGGGNVEVNGKVAGDLLVGAGTVVIAGDVGDDLRIGGGQVRIKGSVGDDVIIGAGFVMIDDGATIGGDLVAGSGSFNLAGKVLGNLKASFGEGLIKGSVAGDAALRYEDKLVFSDSAKISGKLTYWALREDPDFERVAGSIEYHKWSPRPDARALGILGFLIPTLTLGVLVLKYIGILVLGWLLLLLMPKYLVKVSEVIKKNYWGVLWQGLIFLIVVPIIGIIAAATLIGLPVALALGLVYILALLLAGIVAAFTIGSYFIKTGRSKSKQFGALAAGGAVYVLLGTLPIVGWLVKLVFLVLGLGGIWHDSYARIKSDR